MTVDEVDALTRAGGTRLEVAVTGDVAAAADLVRGVAGVSGVEVRGSELLVTADDAAGLQERVASALVGGGFGLRELRVSQRGTLEEAYLRLVGGG